MSPINGVDDHAAFFPINRDDNSTDHINGNNNNNSIPNPAGDNSDFQAILQSLLESMSGKGLDSEVNSLQNSAENTLSSMPGVNSQTKTLLSLLHQLQQPDSSQGSGQAEGRSSNQKLLDMIKLVSKSGAGPISDVPYPRMISNYKLAMRNFQNAFGLSPAGTIDETDMNALKRLLNKDSGVIQDISGTHTRVVNPTKPQIINFITQQCKQIGVPVQLGLATAATESDMTQFNKDGTPFRNSNPDSTDWGIMQINDKAWGDAYDFNRIKSDWKYNVKAGLQILKGSFDAAIKNNEGNKGSNNMFENSGFSKHHF
jgi:hypothetical protein